MNAECLHSAVVVVVVCVCVCVCVCVLWLTRWSAWMDVVALTGGYDVNVEC